MKTPKKLISVILIPAFILSLARCGEVTGQAGDSSSVKTISADGEDLQERKESFLKKADHSQYVTGKIIEYYTLGNIEDEYVIIEAGSGEKYKVDLSYEGRIEELYSLYTSVWLFNYNSVIGSELRVYFDGELPSEDGVFLIERPKDCNIALKNKSEYAYETEDYIACIAELSGILKKNFDNLDNYVFLSPDEAARYIMNETCPGRWEKIEGSDYGEWYVNGDYSFRYEEINYNIHYGMTDRELMEWSDPSSGKARARFNSSGNYIPPEFEADYSDMYIILTALFTAPTEISPMCILNLPSGNMTARRTGTTIQITS